MDVRAKQRLSYRVVFLIRSCVVAVSPHVISAVICSNPCRYANAHKTNTYTPTLVFLLRFGVALEFLRFFQSAALSRRIVFGAIHLRTVSAYPNSYQFLFQISA